MQTTRRIARTIRLVLPSLLLTACWSVPATATKGDFFAKGTGYDTLTYGGHWAKCDGKPIDINVKQAPNDELEIVPVKNDEGIPLYAPEDGWVEEYAANDPLFGKNIYWISDSGEKLFLAHLKQIDKTGRVYGGQKIGELGKSGSPWPLPDGRYSSSPHLHIERCGGDLVLSGKIVEATDEQGEKGLFTSIGQIKKHFYVSEPGRLFFNEGEYGIGWWPPDVPCVKATEWVENRQNLVGVDKTICDKAFNILAWRYWRRDRTYDGWHKIFFEEFNLSYLQCTAR